MKRKLILGLAGLSGLSVATIITIPSLVSPNFSNGFELNKNVYSKFIMPFISAESNPSVCKKEDVNSTKKLFDPIFNLQEEVCCICNQLDIDIPRFTRMLSIYYPSLEKLLETFNNAEDEKQKYDWQNLTKLSFKITGVHRKIEQKIERLKSLEKRLDDLINCSNDSNNNLAKSQLIQKLPAFLFLKRRLENHLVSYTKLLTGIGSEHSDNTHFIAKSNFSLFSKLFHFNWLEDLLEINIKEASVNRQPCGKVTQSIPSTLEYLLKVNNKLLNDSLASKKDYESQIDQINKNIEMNQREFESKTEKELLQKYELKFDDFKQSIFSKFDQQVSNRVNSTIDSKLLDFENSLRKELAIIHKKEIDSILQRNKQDLVELESKSGENHKDLLTALQRCEEHIKYLESFDKQKYDNIILHDLENLLFSDCKTSNKAEIDLIIDKLSGYSQNFKTCLKKNFDDSSLKDRNQLASEFETIIDSKIHHCFFVDHNQGAKNRKINFFRTQIAKLLSKFIVKLDHSIGSRENTQNMPSVSQELLNFQNIFKIRKIMWHSSKDLNEALQILDDLDGRISESLEGWKSDLQKYCRSEFLLDSLIALTLSRLKLEA